MNDLLKNRIIAISGGTKGIGKALVFAASRQGAIVYFSGRDDVAADSICKTLGDEGKTVQYTHVDLTRTEEIEKWFSLIDKKYHRLDAFVNYAGVTDSATLVACEEDTYNAIFDVDMRAAFFCAKYAIQIMMKKNIGTILFFGSPHDDKGEPDRAAYACAKAGLKVLSTHISKYYARYGIKSNYITTGWTPTEGELKHRAEQGMTPEELNKFASQIIPSGSMQTVEDYIPISLLLLSNYGDAISGADIRMTGGLYF